MFYAATCSYGSSVTFQITHNGYMPLTTVAFVFKVANNACSSRPLRLPQVRSLAVGGGGQRTNPISCCYVVAVCNKSHNIIIME